MICFSKITFNAIQKNRFICSMISFHQRPLRFITCHGKLAQAQELINAFDLTVENFTHEHTDQFGTFSGTVMRQGTALENACKKIKLGRSADFNGLILASEGSFGTDPILGFGSLNEEFLVLYDVKNDLELVAVARSHDTNYNQQTVNTFIELQAFADRSHFPSHSLLLHFPTEIIELNGSNWNDEMLQTLFKHYGKVLVSTDMRAMNNPKRQLVIQAAFSQLIDKMKSACPNCNTPGYYYSKSIPGLPCAWCGTPTSGWLYHIKTCIRCSHEEQERNQQNNQDPGFCPSCNP